jgi:hypothetical protein
LADDSVWDVVAVEEFDPETVHIPQRVEPRGSRVAETPIMGVRSATWIITGRRVGGRTPLRSGGGAIPGPVGMESGGMGTKMAWLGIGVGRSSDTGISVVFVEIKVECHGEFVAVEFLDL